MGACCSYEPATETPQLPSDITEESTGSEMSISGSQMLYEDSKYMNEIQTKVDINMSKLMQLKQQLHQISENQVREQKAIDDQKAELKKQMSEMAQQRKEEDMKKPMEAMEKLKKEEQSSPGVSTLAPENTTFSGIWKLKGEAETAEFPGGPIDGAISEHSSVLVLETRLSSEDEVLWGLLRSGSWVVLDNSVCEFDFPMTFNMCKYERRIFAKSQQNKNVSFWEEEIKEMELEVEEMENEKRKVADSLKKEIKNLVKQYEEQRETRKLELQKMQDMINEEKDVLIAQMEEDKVVVDDTKEHIKDVQREMIELHETLDAVKEFHKDSLDNMEIEKGRLQSRLTQANIQIECDEKDLKKMRAKAAELEVLKGRVDALKKTTCLKALKTLQRENDKLKKQMRNLFIQGCDFDYPTPKLNKKNNVKP